MAENDPSQKVCIKAIGTLISDLKHRHPEKHDIDGQALMQLAKLLSAIEGQNRQDMDRCFEALRQFWLKSVAWCSPLSKEIERVLILYDEGE